MFDPTTQADTIQVANSLLMLLANRPWYYVCRDSTIAARAFIPKTLQSVQSDSAFPSKRHLCVRPAEFFEAYDYHFFRVSQRFEHTDQ